MISQIERNNSTEENNPSEYNSENNFDLNDMIPELSQFSFVIIRDDGSIEQFGSDTFIFQKN